MAVFSQLIDKFEKKSALVIGDVMLDEFIHGTVDRISPESPVPVLKYKRSIHMGGGAANVAAGLRALGLKVVLAGVCGADHAGDKLKDTLTKNGIETKYLITDKARPTIRKTRFVAQGQQMLRLDEEIISEISPALQKDLIKAIEKNGKNADVIILSDYAKGVLTRDVIEAAMRCGRPVLVDPKTKYFSKYKGAMVITPNRKELSEAAGLPCSNDEEIEDAAFHIMSTQNIHALIVTRSEDGLSIFEKNKKPVHLQAQTRQVYDVSGAGDTVLAVLAAALSGEASLSEAARLANIAGGIAVTRAGTSVISASDLRAAEINALPYPGIAPCLADRAATAQIRAWQDNGLKVGFTNGCFDILHHGHVSYLARARARCDKLVVGLNHDASVRLLKGKDRPVNDQAARASVIGALGSVDLVVLFGAQKAGEDNTPCALLETLRPDIIFKGGDYSEDQLPEAHVVRKYGGEVDIMPVYEGYSTSNTIQKMKKGPAA